MWMWAGEPVSEADPHLGQRLLLSSWGYDPLPLESSLPSQCSPHAGRKRELRMRGPQVPSQSHLNFKDSMYMHVDPGLMSWVPVTSLPVALQTAPFACTL